MAAIIDEGCQSQYETLRSYLESYLNSPRQLASAKSEQRISARERLSGLSKQQLLDLVTDVYDEIDRRLRHANEMPFLPIRSDLHQKRNQARQKLATMGTAPFKDFASDIMLQIEHRFPPYVEAYNAKHGISQNMDAEREVPVMKSPISPGANDVFQRDLAGDSNNLNADVVNRIREEYETQLESLRQKVQELESVQEDKKAIEAAFRKLELENTRLKEDYELLQEDFNNQQQTANDIRGEAANLLEEIKALTQRNEQMAMELEALQRKSLERQNNHNRAQPQPQVAAGSHDEQGGVIDRARVTAYQAAVDDLIKAARSDSPPSVLVAMKSIVIACKNITEDTESFENSNNSMTSEDKGRLEHVKGMLSAALTALMQSAKNHATTVGGSSVSAIEGAASNLTATIVELIKLLKLKGGDAEPTSNGDYRGPDVTKPAVAENGDGFGLNELKSYLERQTDLIVQSIQTLLHTMRQSANGDDFRDIIQGITTTVADVIRESDKTMAGQSGASLRDRLEPILEDLNTANVKLDELKVSIMDQPQSKTLKQRIASSSYDIARFVKELISLIGEVRFV